MNVHSAEVTPHRFVAVRVGTIAVACEIVQFGAIGNPAAGGQPAAAVVRAQVGGALC